MTSVSLLLLRSCKRSISFLVLWTCLCWLVFRISSNDHPLIQVTKEERVKINTRELLGKALHGKNTSNVSVSTTEKDDFLEPAIDRSPKLTETDLVTKLQPQMPNLPIMYWQQNRLKNMSVNKTCAKYPGIFDLHFNNKYWQATETSNGTFLLYGAYLDVRPTNRLGPTVRILGMVNRLEPTVKAYCQLWYNDRQDPVFTPVLEYKYIWYNKWGNYKQGLYQPYLLACQIPRSHWGDTPASVSVVENQCETATTNLKVINNKLEGEKRKFAVCVKGMDFPEDDLSARLIEWIELLNSMGADKIFLYNLEVHPNVTKVR